MSDNTRDIQFQGFSRSLMNELGDEGFVFEGSDDPDQEERLKQIQLIIARRAYDLVEHTIDQITVDIRELFSDRELLERIPDMDELPKESNHE
jgi:hypothetical protein